MTDGDTPFEIASWYDTWNQTGLDNLTSKTVPLGYATRYNLAFGQLVPSADGSYTVEMTGQFSDAIKNAIQTQAPGARVFAGLGDAGLAGAVSDNNENQNRSTTSIIAWLQSNGYSGISIDAENDGMSAVADFVTQLGPGFRTAGLGIAVSVPWPASGPAALYGQSAVQAFNENVDVLELQDYSSMGTPSDVGPWTQAGIAAAKLMGGISTENGRVQTSLDDTKAWTLYALHNGLAGMFSWRLDNDHGTQGTEEDVDPTFVGAQTIFDTVMEAYARR